MVSKKNIVKAVSRVAYQSKFFRTLGNVGRRNFLTVLNYHRIDHAENRPWLDPSLISASPEQFDEQMALLRKDYSPVNTEDVLAALSGQRALPKRAVLVTVDDGYRDFAEYISPISMKYDIEPLLFVPTAYPAKGGFWWDKLYWAVQNWGTDELETPYGSFSLATSDDRNLVLRRLRAAIKAGDFKAGMAFIEQIYSGSKPKSMSDAVDVLDWDELRALSQNGAAIAAHTHNHPLLTRIPFDEACAEIHQSQEVIRKEIGKALPVFAFPDGQPAFFSPELVKFLKKEGIELGVTTVDRNAVLSEANALYFPRVGVYQKLSIEAFAYRLTPFYKAFGE